VTVVFVKETPTGGILFRPRAELTSDKALPTHPFEAGVFINCPFDKQYEPILQAIFFCVIYLGFNPRIATESADSAENRLDRIVSLIEESKYSIHDLSRCQASRSGEHYRLNMPFELGIDYACRKYYGKGRGEKKILILEEKPYRYQATISDLAGCDIEVHGADYQKAARKVRNWLVGEAGAQPVSAGRIRGAYAAFQEWNYERLLAEDFSEDDIQDYPTSELLSAMRDWIAEGKPLG